jgi:hypothetical protein
MIVVIGLIIAFVLVAIFSNRATRQCRWRRNAALDQDGIYWHCLQCGASVMTDTKETPKLCHDPKSQ